MHVCVIGAGFGALTAVRALRKADDKLKITLVAPNKSFVYYPSLIWIPTGLRQGADLVVPLDRFLTAHHADFHRGAVATVKDGGRTVVTESGEEIANDGLIIASGGRFIRKLPGIENAIIPCSGVKEAEAIRDRLEALYDTGGTVAMGFGGNPKEPSGVRGGPVFEFLFGLDTHLRRKDLRDKINLMFFSPAPKPGIRMGERAVNRIMDEMARREIDTHLGQKMKSFAPTRVETEGGGFDADLIVFMPGLTGPAWAQNTELPLSPGGMIKADEFCRVEGWQHTYVAGDSGSFPGPDWMPKQAHMADLQANAAAANLLGGFNGERPKKTFRVELICVIDTVDKGTMVYRDQQRNLIFPMAAAGHWSKRLFEWHYLRAFR